MKTINRLILGIFAAAFLTVAVAGCKHTANGVGKDMEDASEKIQEKTK